MQQQMSPEREKAARALRQVATAILEGVKAGGDLGAPSGVMFAALMGQLSLDQFNQIMRGLQAGGYVRKHGDLYYWVKDLPQ